MAGKREKHWGGAEKRTPQALVLCASLLRPGVFALLKHAPQEQCFDEQNITF